MASNLRKSFERPTSGFLFVAALAAVLGLGAPTPCSAFQAAVVIAPGKGLPEAPQDTMVVTLPAPANSAAGSGGPRPWTQPSDSTAGPAASSNGLMWKASSATNTVYLLGSIHLASPDLYPLPQHIEDAFQKSSVLLVEVDLNRVDQRKIQALLMANGLYPLNDSLWNHISPDTKALVTRFCEENGFNPEVFARMKPWLATVTASALPMQRSGMNADLGIDKHFLESAKGVMRVEQLESAEWQIRLLADLPEIKQERYLAATLKGATLTQQLGQDLQATWLSGDASKLDSLLSSASQESAELAKRIFADRNLRMAGAVERYLRGSERCFMVVGAGHMVGKDGVVRLLQKRGFKVEQVFSKN